jgi:hypothetical protein
MPKIRPQNLPPALLNHLLDRIKSRQISADQLGALADWLDKQPEVPTGKWFKRFSGMIGLRRRRTGEDIFDCQSGADRRGTFLTSD